MFKFQKMPFEKFSFGMLANKVIDCSDIVLATNSSGFQRINASMSVNGLRRLYYMRSWKIGLHSTDVWERTLDSTMQWCPGWWNHSRILSGVQTVAESQRQLVWWRYGSCCIWLSIDRAFRSGEESGGFHLSCRKMDESCVYTVRKASNRYNKQNTVA